MTTNIFYTILLSCLCVLAYVATKWLGRSVDRLGVRLAAWAFEDEEQVYDGPPDPLDVAQAGVNDENAQGF